jgi:NTP pyrophosphatase (non-canonical NTP hydrolase)
MNTKHSQQDDFPNKLTVDQYQTDAARTLWDKPKKKLYNVQTMALWCAIGIAGEAGEVNEVIKKWVFHNHKFNKERVREELGDLLWYITGLCTTLGISLADVMIENIDKLKRRYPEGFSYEGSKH